MGLLASARERLSTKHSVQLPDLPLILMGFSKGGLVLNHLLLEEELDTSPLTTGGVLVPQPRAFAVPEFRAPDPGVRTETW